MVENNANVIIYSPHDISMRGYDETRKISKYKNIGIELDIPGTVPAVKDYFAPLLPFEICAIQAQTSNGKTLFKDWWMRKIAAQFKKQGRDAVLVDVHLEETIEQVAFSEYGRLLDVTPAALARGEYQDFEGMKAVQHKIDGVPIWHIGVSSEDADDAPELTLSNIARAIKALKDGELTGEPFEIGVVAVDYLQVLPIDPEVKTAKLENQRRLQVMSDVNRLRALTSSLQAPIIVPLQAKQDLKSTVEPFHIPQMYDGMETSAIATRFDRIISLWMPSTTHPNLIGREIEGKTESVTVGANNMWMQVIKQRGG
jgi:replicative DNA helicase